MAALWSAQPPQRGLAQTVTAQILDHYVFSKPFFDRNGVIIAEDDGEMAGFIHIGFGPNEEQTDISTEIGVICMLMVDPKREYKALAEELLRHGNSHLRAQGAKLIYGGCIDPVNPFYLGLYGGSEMPGVLASDTDRVDLLLSNDFQEIDRCIVLQRKLNGFRLPVDRRQLQLRRKFRLELDQSPPPLNWWESCASPPSEPTRFELIPIHGGPACGSVSFWLIEPISINWGALSVGMTRLEVPEKLQRQGLATFLNAEALRQLQLNGVGIVEVQTMVHNSAARGLYRKLGFVEVDQGIVFRKS